MSKQVEAPQDKAPRPSPHERLDSWKEIAAYLKCSERTVRRWEEEGLPVHRHTHKKKPGIYAYKTEIDVWWRNGHERLGQIEDAPEQPSAVFRWRSPRLAAGLALSVLLVALVTFAVFQEHQQTLHNAPAPHIQSLAVLPLENLSPDPEQEYFADGMTDTLITDLAQISSLKVISRTSSMRYKGARKSLPQIAQELSVDGIVEGTVQRSGDHVRITAQLIHGPSDKHLWAHSYDGEVRDILTIQSEVARSIARQIEIQLTPSQHSRLASALPINRDAYELYLKGRFFWNKRDPESLNKALEYFQQSTEKEPGYAPSYTGLADTYSLLSAAGYDVLPRAEAMEKARAAAGRALGIDDGLAEAHASLGYVMFSFDWDWPAAEKQFQTAIALNPNYSTAHQWYSDFLSDQGRTEQALAEAQSAVALDPLSLLANHYVARAQYFGRQFDQALETSQRILGMDPNFAIAHLRLGRAYAAKGMYHQAIPEFEEFARLSGDSPLAVASIGNALARSGDRDGAIRILKELAIRSREKRVPPMCFALVHIGLGDKDKAMAWLEKAYKERTDFLLVLKVDTLFDPLRSDPRFADLLRRIHLPADSTNGLTSHY